MLAPHAQHAIDVEPLHDRHAPDEVHTWELRGVEFEDAVTAHRYECVDCAAVRYE